MAPFATYAGIPGRLTPIVQHGAGAFYLVLPLMGLVPRSRLTQPAGTVKQYRDDIVRAIDWLFTGI